MGNIANKTTKEMSLSTFGKGMLSSVYTDTGSTLLQSSVQNFATSYEDANVIEIIS